jgi:hypothetical protein
MVVLVTIIKVKITVLIHFLLNKDGGVLTTKYQVTGG